MISIFSMINNSGPILHYWLAQDSRFGPQCYLPGKNFANGLGQIVAEQRDPFEHITQELIDTHQHTHQLLENNLPDDKGVINCVYPFRQYENDYDNVVWSNFFGMVNWTEQCEFDTEKAILVKCTDADHAFHYISGYALRPLLKEEIDFDSKIWYEDHTMMEDKFLIETWKDIWYGKYHNKCQELWDNGTLRHMWQLNFLHWDLWNAIDAGKNEIDMDITDERLFSQFKNHPGVQNNKLFIRDYKGDKLVVESDWYDQYKEILGYCDVISSDVLRQYLKELRETYKTKRGQFEEKYGHLL